MVIFLNARGNSQLVACFVFVELVRDLAEDWNKLRFLVELEVVVDVPVDLSVRESRHEGTLHAGSRTMDRQGGNPK